MTDGNFYFAIRSSAEGTTNPNAGDNDLFHGVRFKDGTCMAMTITLLVQTRRLTKLPEQNPTLTAQWFQQEKRMI